jgi:hypothetical protein
MVKPIIMGVETPSANRGSPHAEDDATSTPMAGVRAGHAGNHTSASGSGPIALPCGMLEFLLGCAGARTPWDLVDIDDAREEPIDADAALVRREIHEFGKVAAADTVRLDTARLVDALPLPPGDVENADGERALLVSGTYDAPAKRVLLVPGAGALAENTRHELCHALDFVTGLSSANADWLTVDALPESIKVQAQFLPGKEAEEVFATLCEQPAPSWIDRALDDACGTTRIPAMLRHVRRLALPGAEVATLPTVWLPIEWVEPDLPQGWRVTALVPIAGTAWVLLEGREPAVATVDLDGTTDLAPELPEDAEADGLRLLPSDRRVVLVGSRIWSLDGDEWRAVPVPLALDDAAVHGDVLVASHGASMLTIDLESGARQDLDPPDGLDAADGRLVSRIGHLLFVSGERSWEFDGDGWDAPRDEPSPLDHTYSEVTLGDGRQIASWSADNLDGVEEHGLAIRSAAGVTLSDDSCEKSIDAVDLLTDGDVVWARSGDRYGRLALD